jgi:catechol 2,3-dioxygenase
LDNFESDSEQAGFDLMAFKVVEDADLDRFEQRITEYGIAVDHVPAAEMPGIGRRIGFTIPSGHRIELFAQSEHSEPKPRVHNPDVWEVDPHGMRPRRFDHALLYGPEIEKTQDFFERVLDFRVAESATMPDGLLATWMSCGMKAHDIAFVKYPEPNKLHHVSFELENWNDVGHAADVITRYDISIDIGPTRHGITRGQTIYFFDPSGNRNEVFAGGYTYYPDIPTRTWDEKEIGKGIFYYERQLNDAFLSVVT